MSINYIQFCDYLNNEIEESLKDINTCVGREDVKGVLYFEGIKDALTRVSRELIKNHITWELINEH